MTWSNEDPRYSIYKLRPIVVYDQVLNKVFIATVETKHEYSIWAPDYPKDNLRSIGNNEPWPHYWYWCYPPTKE